jgi:hypothetical protein
LRALRAFLVYGVSADDSGGPIVSGGFTAVKLPLVRPPGLRRVRRQFAWALIPRGEPRGRIADTTDARGEFSLVGGTY